VMDGGVIGAMDFGMVGRISPAVRSDLTRLYMAVVSMDGESIVDEIVSMGAAGPQLDRSRLQRDMERLLGKYSTMALGEIRVQELMEDVLPVAFRHRISFPPDLWLLEKTVAMMEGVGVQLDPTLNVFEVVGEHVRRTALHMVSPKVWGKQVVKSAGDWGEMVSTAPRRATRLLDRLERGELEFGLSLRDLDQTVNRLDNLGNRLAIAMLIAALIVSLALLIPTMAAGGRGFAFWLVLSGFVVATFLGFYLLLSMFRAGRPRRRR
jgi:ubiquinone biosynthesis protein